MNVTGIEWTATALPDGTLRPGFTSNPLKYRDRTTGETVWACVKHSPGCAHCYSESLALRYGRGGPFTREQMEKVEPFIDDAELRKLLTAKTVGGVPVSGSHVFVGDMTDMFGDWVTDDMLDKLFAVFALRSDVTFQVLTKRADRVAAYMNGVYRRGAIADAAVKSFEKYIWRNTVGHAHKANEIAGPDWPLSNVWLGVSVENQAAADDRIPHLLRTPAAVRFLSCEPLLGEVILHKYLAQCQCGHGHGFTACPNTGGVAQTCHLSDCRKLRSLLGWVIVGGESGHGARPCLVEWSRSLVKQCKAASVPMFVKQLGSHPRALTGTGVAEVIALNERKGGDMAEWPEDLRVRQFPAVEATR